MSKINVGIGDEFPVNEAPEPSSGEHYAYACGRMRAHWAARRAARLERWRQWCEAWHGAQETKPRPPSPGQDASYGDVPPRKDGGA